MSGSTGRPPEVAVVGSINIDLVTTVERHALPGETILASDYTESLGGKGFNQAIAAAKRVPTHLIGCVGDDAFGARAMQTAEGRGVSVTEVAHTDTPTGRALIEVARGGENRIVVAPLANHVLTAERVTAALDRLRPVAVLTQLEIPLDTVEATASWCRANDARFILNPSPVATLPPEILAVADPLIVNEREAEALLTVLPNAERVDVTDHAAAAEALRRVARSVVITAGAKGATFTDEADSGHSAGTRVEVVDTTGAGDEFAGTLLAALATGETLGRATILANTSAAVLVATARSRR
ncbi:ribokinase [Stackebrandtia endophytica]|uniref:Ribokinase n=1 Tax=Stackebrandtia endophytica TaxID=1496996 RepID=A0A543AQC0_9ACTN|nr:ribokinase [Stackebrandtia endophytica]TQL74725.1 ribokinase [Stackebrandtia endophytica]